MKMKKLIWVVPDEKDARFSKSLLRRIKASAKSLGVSEFSLEIWEQYETENRPHYHIKVEVGVYSNRLNKGFDVSTSYSATANGKSDLGFMMICFNSKACGQINSILGTGSFFMYDEAIRKDYSEYKTDYINFHLNSV